MSNNLVQLKKSTFTRTLLGACCLFALQANAHAAHDSIFVTKQGDAVFRVSDANGVTLSLSSGTNSGDITYTLVNSNGTTTSMLSGVTRNVVVRTKAGMDTLRFSNLEVANSLNIISGSNADTVEFFGVTVGKNLNVNTGKGDDVVTGGLVGVHGNTRINTGQDNDEIEIGGFTTERRLFIASGTGNDFVDLEDMITGGQTLVNTGRGDDDVALTSIENTNTFRLRTGQGNDNVELADLNFTRKSDFHTGKGDDTLSVSESQFSHVAPRFNGGKGKDTFGDEQNNTFDGVEPRISQFEDIIDISEPVDPTTYQLGDIGPGGGIVFQVDTAGTTGLEIMPVDLTSGSGIAYGCAGINVANVNDTSDGINDLQPGIAKTAALILEGCAEAAVLADTYVSANGLNDWFLPSAPELKTAIDQGIVLPNPGFPYWSSSEQTEGNAFQVFNTTLDLPPSTEDKSLSVTEGGLTVGVAPVRQFAPAQ